MSNHLVIYQGEIPQNVYDAAYEWISVLYEADKLKENHIMVGNIKNRSYLLNADCEDYVTKEFAEKHAQSMYGSKDVNYCTLATLGDHKIAFLGYKTHYEDLYGNKYYGITAEMNFDSNLYAKTRQVPSYISENDMGFQLYVEVIFDSENKIAGWIEEFYKNSEKDVRFSTFIISPDEVGYMDDKGYFEPIFDETFLTPTDVVYTKYKSEMFLIEKELMYLLKDNTTFFKENFSAFADYCSKEILNSTTVNEFLSEFIGDIKKYNVHFEFDPFTIAELGEKQNVQIKVCKNTRYGDVYFYSSGGHKKTGSKEFNEKYALGQDGYSFNIQYYFTIEDDKPKLLGIMLDKYNSEFSETLPDDLTSLWNGIKVPIIEEQG